MNEGGIGRLRPKTARRFAMLSAALRGSPRPKLRRSIWRVTFGVSERVIPVPQAGGIPLGSAGPSAGSGPGAKSKGLFPAGEPGRFEWDNAKGPLTRPGTSGSLCRRGDKGLGVRKRAGRRGGYFLLSDIRVST